MLCRKMNGGEVVAEGRGHNGGGGHNGSGRRSGWGRASRMAEGVAGEEDEAEGIADGGARRA